jgi:HAD superfamily hydrolase (TIGR01509 family)
MQEPFSVKAILWDVDGTLIDTTALIVSALDQTYKKFAGRSLDYDGLRCLIGIPLMAQMRVLGDPASFGATADEMAEECLRRYEIGKDQETVIPVAIEALKMAKKHGILTALVTSKSAQEVSNTLPRLGIEKYCDTVVCADDVAPDYKPHPRPAALALERLGIADPREAVFVGDSVYDMQCGRGAGARICAVTWGAGPEALLRAEIPDWCLSEPEELLALVQDVWCTDDKAIAR